MFHIVLVEPEIPPNTGNVRIAPDLYRLPDVAVFSVEPTERHPSHPPLIAVEIVSLDDSYSYMLTKLADYRHWGVAHIWVVDPHAKKLQIFDGTLREVESFELPAYGFSLTLADLLS